MIPHYNKCIRLKRHDLAYEERINGKLQKVKLSI